jgi:hypothetical protein
MLASVLWAKPSHTPEPTNFTLKPAYGAFKFSPLPLKEQPEPVRILKLA